MECPWAVNQGVEAHLTPYCNPLEPFWGEELAEHPQALPMLSFGQKWTPTVDILYLPPELPLQCLSLFVCISRVISVVDIDTQVCKMKVHTSASLTRRLSK
jgi:hypothetical protein